MIDVCFEVHTKDTNTLWLERGTWNVLMLNLAVYVVTTGLRPGGT